jgi:hypothetical protein
VNLDIIFLNKKVNLNSIFSIGANIYIGIETPYEKALYAEKQKVARKIESSADYLAAVFWSYVKDYDLYNYTYPQ